MLKNKYGGRRWEKSGRKGAWSGSSPFGASSRAGSWASAWRNPAACRRGCTCGRSCDGGWTQGSQKKEGTGAWAPGYDHAARADDRCLKLFWIPGCSTFLPQKRLWILSLSREAGDASGHHLLYRQALYGDWPDFWSHAHYSSCIPLCYGLCCPFWTLETDALLLRLGLPARRRFDT